MRTLRITVEGKSYDVTVEALDGGEETAPAATAPQRAVPIRSASVTAAAPLPSPPAPTAPSAPSGPGLVTSPLAGKVVTVHATIGQQVKAGDQLIVLEAMKMNTFVHAPNDGKVAEILINAGDAVEEGQALLRLD